MPRKAKSVVESSGAVVEETKQSENSSAVATSELPKPTESTSEKSQPLSDKSSLLEEPTANPSSAEETPEPPVFARLRQKAEQEAVNGSGGPKGPHPYEYTIDNAGLVPAAFRDESYNVSDELIQAHFQDAYDHGRNPVVSGLMIGMKQ